MLLFRIETTVDFRTPEGVKSTVVFLFSVGISQLFHFLTINPFRNIKLQSCKFVAKNRNILSFEPPYFHSEI